MQHLGSTLIAAAGDNKAGPTVLKRKERGLLLIQDAVRRRGQESSEVKEKKERFLACLEKFMEVLWVAES